MSGSKKNKYTRLLIEIKKQARYPTAGDQYIGNLYKALLILAKNDKTIINLIVNAQNERLKKKNFLTDSHALYLVLNAINYLMIYKERIPDYPFVKRLGLDKPTGWVNLIKHLLQSYKKTLFQLLLEKNNQQNIIERGIHIPFLVHTIFGNRKLKIADLGCSENLIWSFLASRSTFNLITDYTKFGSTNRIINRYSKQPISVNEVIGVDQNIPHKNKDSLEWLISCRHPKEVKPNLIKKSINNIKKYQKVKNVKSLEGNIFNPPLNTKYFDIVSINNVLYQITQKKRKLILKTAISLLNKQGLLIVQDNCYVDNKGQIAFTNSRKAYTYRICLSGPIIMKKVRKNWLEILKYKSTRCLEVKEGKDFKLFCSLFSSVQK